MQADYPAAHSMDTCFFAIDRGATSAVGGRERRCYRWHSRWVTCVAVAPDGMTAAAGSADRTVVVWDLDDA